MELTTEQIQAIAKSIQMYKVSSSNIDAIGYNPNNSVMRVIFKGGSSYLYFNVDENTWNIIKSSESVGKSLNECVVRQKDKYKYLKLC